MKLYFDERLMMERTNRLINKELNNQLIPLIKKILNNVDIDCLLERCVIKIIEQYSIRDIDDLRIKLHKRNKRNR